MARPNFSEQLADGFWPYRDDQRVSGVNGPMQVRFDYYIVRALELL
jgi:hypothetical protein